MSSIRVRLAVTALAVFVVALLLAGLFVLEANRNSLESALDVSLETRADDIAALLEQGLRPDGLGINADEDTFAMVIDPAGNVVTTTDRFGDPQELIDLDIGPEGATVSLFSFAETGGLERMRVQAIVSRTGEQVVVGQSLHQIDEQVADLRTTLLITGPLLALAAAAATALAVARALRPVEAMRLQADQISVADQQMRLPTPRRSDELGQLATTFNDMLERLEHAADSQRQLTADIAHELRSPITAIATLHEVDLAHPDQAAWDHTAAEVLDETRRLRILIDNLLLLAKIDAEAEIGAQDLVDLDEIVLTIVQRTRIQTSAAFDLSRLSAGLVEGDQVQLEQVVQNLIDNAIRHADEHIRVALSDDGTTVELTVTNDGETIPTEDRERIFDRFYRTQQARDRQSGGTGLGLAITRSILTLHNATITARPDPPGTTFTARFPSVDRAR